MIVVAAFTDNAAPATGLTPTIRIRRTDTQALVVTDVAMTEQGEGLYSYDFAGFVDTLDYSIRADGGAGLADAERYVFGAVGAIDAEILATDAVNKIRDAILSDSTSFAGADISLIFKILNNRLELADGSSNNWVLYDDDDTTPLLTWDVTDKLGGNIGQVPGIPSRRTRGL